MKSNPSSSDQPLTHASYPSEQTYVVKLLRRSGTETPRPSGRLVHLASGDMVIFEGADELVERLLGHVETHRWTGERVRERSPPPFGHEP